MRDRPCRHYCNRPGCSPSKCLGRTEYGHDDPRRWVGLGLMPVAGKPLGWSHAMETRAIEQHLRRQGRYTPLELPFRVRRIQERLHREWPSRWAAIKGERKASPSPQGVPFSSEELQHLVDLFDGANDPLSASIATKARMRLHG